jgi:transcriptional regulator with XRE-family HTH domain
VGRGETSLPPLKDNALVADRGAGVKNEEAGVDRPADEVVLIGARLKAARLARGLTLEEIASASGLTKGFLSRLERDRAGGSVASLVRLCNALDIAVGSLFDEYSGELVRADQYPPINFGGEQLAEFLLTPTGEHRLQAILSEIKPGGGSGPEAYSLKADVEFVFVLEGSLVVSMASQELVMQKGDALTFSAHSPHWFRNPDTETVTKVLWVLSPALHNADQRRLA